MKVTAPRGRSGLGAPVPQRGRGGHSAAAPARDRRHGGRGGEAAHRPPHRGIGAPRSYPIPGKRHLRPPSAAPIPGTAVRDGGGSGWLCAPPSLTGAFGRFPAAARGCGARGAAGRAGPSRGAARSGVPARCGAAKSPPGPGPGPRRAPSCAPAPRIPPAGSPGGRGAHGGTPGGTDPPRPSRAAAVGTGAAHSWERDTAKAAERAAGRAWRHRSWGSAVPRSPRIGFGDGWSQGTPLSPACVGAALGSQCPEPSRLLGAVVAVPVVNGTRRNAAPIPVRAGPAVTSRLRHPGCCRARCQPGPPLK